MKKNRVIMIIQWLTGYLEAEDKLQGASKDLPMKEKAILTLRETIIITPPHNKEVGDRPILDLLKTIKNQDLKRKLLGTNHLD
jgi:hypothetical protein